MSNDIADLTDAFSDIVEHYKGDMGDALLDMDAWELEDLEELLVIVGTVLEMRYDRDYPGYLDDIDEENFNAEYDEYTKLS